MKHPSEDHSVFHVDIIDDAVDGLISDLHSLHALKHSSVSELSKFACIDVLDSNSNSDSDDAEYDVDNVESTEFDSLDVVPIDFDAIQSGCTNHVAGSTYTSDCYAQVQAVEPISPSPLVPDIQPASSTPELKPLPDNLKYVYLEEQDKCLSSFPLPSLLNKSRGYCTFLRSIRRQLDGHWLTSLVLAHQHACTGYYWKMEQSR